jgi:hypothetical protein
MATNTATHIESFDKKPDSAGVRLPVACAMLSCSPATAWRLIGRGKLQAIKVAPRVTIITVGSIRTLLNGGA